MRARTYDLAVVWPKKQRPQIPLTFCLEGEFLVTDLLLRLEQITKEQSQTSPKASAASPSQASSARRRIPNTENLTNLSHGPKKSRSTSDGGVDIVVMKFCDDGAVYGRDYGAGQLLPLQCATSGRPNPFYTILHSFGKFVAFKQGN